MGPMWAPFWMRRPGVSDRGERCEAYIDRWLRHGPPTQTYPPVHVSVKSNIDLSLQININTSKNYTNQNMLRESMFEREACSVTTADSVYGNPDLTLLSAGTIPTDHLADSLNGQSLVSPRKPFCSLFQSS